MRFVFENFSHTYFLINIRNLLFGLLLLFFNLNLLAQAPSMRQYTVEDGLPSSNVYTCFEDSRGFMWFGTDKGLTRFDGYRFKVYDLSDINGSNEVWGMEEDRDGRVWCASFNNLLYFEGEEFHAVPLPDTLKTKMVSKYFMNEHGNSFVQLQGVNGLFEIFTNDSIRLVPIHFPKLEIEVKIIRYNFLKEASDGTKWFSAHTVKGIYIYKKQKHQVELVTKLNPPQKEDFTNFDPFILDDSSVLFFAPNHAYQFDYQRFKKQSFKNIFEETLILKRNHQQQNLGIFFTETGCRVLNKTGKPAPGFEFLKERELNSLREDSRGNLWICTPSEGIYFLTGSARQSQTFSDFPLNSGVKITSFTVDENENFWLGLSDGNLIKSDIKFQNSKIDLSFSDRFKVNSGHPIKYLRFDREGNLILISNFGFSLILSNDMLSRSKLHFDFSTIPQKNLSGSLVTFIDETETGRLCGMTFGSPKHFKHDEQNRMLLASSFGVLEILKKPNKFEIREISDRRSYAAQRQNDIFWIGEKGGFFKKSATATDSSALEKVSGFDFSITALEVSESNSLWIAGEGEGLFRYDGSVRDTIFELVNSKEIIIQLTKDKSDNIWGVSNQGIFKISMTSNTPFNYRFKRFSPDEGLPNREVTQILVRENLIYALTSVGISILKDLPDSLESAPRKPIFTDFKINRQSQAIRSKYSLPHTDNDLSFEFSSLAFDRLDKTRFRYKMEGVDEDWQVTNEPTVSYHTLTPDNYIFRLKAVGEGGIESEENPIEIKISSPWNQTWAAYFGYAVIILGLFYLFYRIRLNQKLAHQKALQLEEIVQRKNLLFSNITHEFRTPLTLILGLAEEMDSSDALENPSDKLKKHGGKLLHLINQILELTKSEEGNATTNLVRGDIVFFIRQMVDSFSDFAKAKKIKLELEVSEGDFAMDFDPAKLQTVLFNLISNALKFTPKGGQISIRATLPGKNEIQAIPDLKKVSKSVFQKFSDSKNDTSDSFFLLTAEDSGIGISAEDLPFIFDRFYQADSAEQSGIDSGTGIGLALTKETVEQMNGRIFAESKVGIGTIFKIYLPITRTAEQEASFELKNDLSEFIAAEAESTEDLLKNQPADSTLPSLLIVEDDSEMLNYLISILKNRYEISVAKNGKEGIEAAFESIPDLILADIMMPKTDGFTLCKILKQDIRTSHIPIVFLTAKTLQKDRLEGLSLGADAYLTKPFDKSELLIRLEKLYELRLVFQKRYSGDIAELNFSKTKKSAFKIEDDFIIKLRDFIEQNIENDQLTVEQICKAVQMSRTPLHKKMVALTGASVTKFVRKVKLEKAEKLLLETNLSISEIAHRTGFSTNYFIKTFSTVYGCTPNIYRTKNTG